MTGTTFNSGSSRCEEQAVSTTLVAALDPTLASLSGSYIGGCAAMDARKYFNSAENAKKLWELSEELVEQKFEF